MMDGFWSLFLWIKDRHRILGSWGIIDRSELFQVVVINFVPLLIRTTASLRSSRQTSRSGIYDVELDMSLSRSGSRRTRSNRSRKRFSSLVMLSHIIYQLLLGPSMISEGRTSSEEFIFFLLFRHFCTSEECMMFNTLLPEVLGFISCIE